MRRTPRVVIDRRGVLISLVAELRTRTLIVDVEPFLSTWDAAADTVIAATTAFATEITARIPSLEHLVFATNAQMPFIKTSSIDGGFLFMSAARKPWRRNYLKDSPRPITYCVTTASSPTASAEISCTGDRAAPSRFGLASRRLLES